MMLKKSRTVTFFILTVLTTVANAAFFIVDRFEDGVDEFINGECAATNFVGARCTLRAAIMEANATLEEDTILIPQGSDFLLSLVGEDEDSAFSGDLDIVGKLTIVNGLNGFVIDGNKTDRIFHILNGAHLTLENGTLTNGVANTVDTFEGGAIKIEEGGTLITSEIKFVNNLANRGGAVFNDGTALLQDSYLHHNAITSESEPLNLPSEGSAILNRKTLWLVSSTLSYNGILLSNPQNTQINSGEYAIHINPNGINAEQPNTLISNSTLAFNQPSAIRSYRGITTLLQTTIANHSSRGMRFTRHSDYADTLQLTIKRSLFANNGSYDCNQLQFLPLSEVSILGNYNASTGDTCGFSGVNNLQNISNPINGSLYDWGGKTPTLMIDSSSSIVDFVVEGCSSEDQRGGFRPLDGNNNGISFCDAGAVELDRTTDPLVSDIIFSNGFEVL